MDFGRVVKSFGAQTTDDSLNNYSLIPTISDPTKEDKLGGVWPT